MLWLSMFCAKLLKVLYAETKYKWKMKKNIDAEYQQRHKFMKTSSLLTYIMQLNKQENVNFI